MAGFEPGFLEGHLTLLGERGFEAVVEADPEVALGRLVGERFEVVVARYPLQPGAVGALVGELRKRGSLNVSSGLILLADPASLRAAAGLVGRGASKALSNAEDPSVLAIVVEQMVELALPMAERLPLRYPVESTVGGSLFQWTTENLSGAGMLVESDDPPTVGSSIHFTLELPSGDVQGEAKVVRHVNAGREPVAGFGARFLSFVGNGKARLLDVLRGAREEAAV